MKTLRVSDNSTSAINAALAKSLGPAFRWSDCSYVTASAGVFTVEHNLGVVPETWHWDAKGNVFLYATDANRAAWTKTHMTLTGTAAVGVCIYAGTRKE